MFVRSWKSLCVPENKTFLNFVCLPVQTNYIEAFKFSFHTSFIRISGRNLERRISSFCWDFHETHKTEKLSRLLRNCFGFFSFSFLVKQKLFHFLPLLEFHDVKKSFLNFPQPPMPATWLQTMKELKLKQYKFKAKVETLDSTHSWFLPEKS